MEISRRKVDITVFCKLRADPFQLQVTKMIDARKGMAFWQLTICVLKLVK